MSARKIRVSVEIYEPEPADEYSREWTEPIP